MIANWKFPQMWTFTVNPVAYPDRRKILEWIKEKRSISTLIQTLWRRKLLTSREFYAVMEFQSGERNASGVGTEQVHFHVLLDTPGYLNWETMWQLWESKAPPWRETGTVCDKHNPAMGFVRFDKVYKSAGLAEYLSKGVAGYLSKGPKNLPAWFVDYLNDGHNMQMRYYSRGFFKSLEKPKPKYKRKPVATPRKRRTVAERLEQCRHDADAYIVVSGKPVWIDRAFFNWEECLAKLQAAMSPQQFAECKKLGRVSITAAEFMRLVGVEGYRRMMEANGGQPVGLAVYSEAEAIMAKKNGVDDVLIIPAVAGFAAEAGGTTTE